jgi:transposase
MMKPPEFIGATQAQIDALLALAKSTFPTQDYELLKGILDTFSYVMRDLQDKKASLKRFRQMLFGASTERTRNLFKGASTPGEHPSTAATPSGDTSTDNSTPEAPSDQPAKPASPRPPRVGHGRNGADKYSNAPVIQIGVAHLKSGDPCPECKVGRIYEAPPKTLVRVVGQPPLTATVYKLEHLRCRLCDATVTASLPEDVSPSKYDASCASMLALLRYGSGVPFYRLEGLQGSLNVPLPDATQWQIVRDAVPAPEAVFDELTRQAAQGDVLHCDDTPAKVLSLVVDRNKREAAGQTVKNKAINTSGIVALLPQGNHQVALFFTGQAHAGTNLSNVLAQRANELPLPIQMSDALASNFVGEFARIIALCLTHGRRNFVGVIDQFPQACAYVINIFSKIYAHDAQTRELNLSPGERLLYHQVHSAELMQELKSWMTTQLDQRLVEPNSGLGKACGYMLKHWEGLTVFLRKEGAPLDNNHCEQALKKVIMHRKNSMFYRTLNGARVGDVYMSLIHTCALCKVNPFEYLQALHTHAQAVMSAAAQWLPWNYREQLAKPA